MRRSHQTCRRSSSAVPKVVGAGAAHRARLDREQRVHGGGAALAGELRHLARVRAEAGAAQQMPRVSFAE